MQRQGASQRVPYVAHMAAKGIGKAGKAMSAAGRLLCVSICHLSDPFPHRGDS